MKKLLLATTNLTLVAAFANEGTELTTPVGRIVWGHPTESKGKTDNNNQPVMKDGVQVQEWAFGLAIPKDQFAAVVWPVMAQEIAKGYPNGAPGKFSYKFIDGDGIDNAGKPYSERAGHAGCNILAISTTLQATPVFKNEGGAYRQLGPNEIKCGDYVAVGLNFVVNVPTNPTHTPSIYVNPTAIELVGYGEEIKGNFTADPNAIFGGQQHALPPGASATPIAPTSGAAMPGMSAPPAAQAPAMQPPPAATPAPAAPTPAPAMQPAPPATMPPPATDFVANAAGQSPPVPPQMPAPAPTGPVRPTDPAHVSDNGNGTEQWFVNGAWDGQAHPVGGAPAAPAMPGMMPPR